MVLLYCVVWFGYYTVENTIDTGQYPVIDFTYTQTDVNEGGQDFQMLFVEKYNINDIILKGWPWCIKVENNNSHILIAAIVFNNLYKSFSFTLMVLCCHCGVCMETNWRKLSCPTTWPSHKSTMCIEPGDNHGEKLVCYHCPIQTMHVENTLWLHYIHATVV